MSNKTVFQSFGKYVRDTLDLDGNGIISIRELFNGISGSAIGIAFLVVDLLVLVAEYRVWDVGIKITADPYKAVGFVLVSALPFYLAQVLWLYPRANWLQQGIALIMGASALYTSARFGLADLSLQYNVPEIISMVIYLTAGYIVLLILYILIDERIKANRMRVRARAKADFHKEFTALSREILQDMEITKAEEDKVRARFGDDAVNSLYYMRDKMRQRPQEEYYSDPSTAGAMRNPDMPPPQNIKNTK